MSQLERLQNYIIHIGSREQYKYEFPVLTTLNNLLLKKNENSRYLLILSLFETYMYLLTFENYKNNVLIIWHIAKVTISYQSD